MNLDAIIDKYQRPKVAEYRCSECFTVKYWEELEKATYTFDNGQTLEVHDLTSQAVDYYVSINYWYPISTGNTCGEATNQSAPITTEN